MRGRRRKRRDKKKNSPHPVVARARRTPYHDGELGHVDAAHRGDELCAVLGDPPLLRVLPDHEAADVLQEDERHVALAAQLDKVRALERALAEQDAVVGHDAHGVPVDLGEARHQRGPVQGLELGEDGPVDDARDDLVDGNLPAEVGARDAGEVGGVVEGFLEGGLRGG